MRYYITYHQYSSYWNKIIDEYPPNWIEDENKYNLPRSVSDVYPKTLIFFKKLDEDLYKEE